MEENKSTSFLQKILYFINSSFAVLLLLSYISSYISPKYISYFSIISLVIPVLSVINFIFFVYWIIKLKKYFLISGVVLLIGWFIYPPFLKFSEKETVLTNDIKVMSYNVRVMNYHKWINSNDINDKIIYFVKKNNPDILAVQEYHHSRENKFKFPYYYFVPKSKSRGFGLAIFSKYKIINKGSLNFEESSNNSIFIDVVKNKDTIRIYNLHLQSLKINPNEKNLNEEKSKKLVYLLKTGFKKQAEQTKVFLNHEQQFKGNKIICTDLNNTAFSWAYKQIVNNKKDAFIEAGFGFGKTFDHFLPMRIDFILTNEKANINSFKTFKIKYSDHYPIMARINFNK